MRRSYLSTGSAARWPTARAARLFLRALPEIWAAFSAMTLHICAPVIAARSGSFDTLRISTAISVSPSRTHHKYTSIGRTRASASLMINDGKDISEGTGGAAFPLPPLLCASCVWIVTDPAHAAQRARPLPFQCPFISFVKAVGQLATPIPRKPRSCVLREIATRSVGSTPQSPRARGFRPRAPSTHASRGRESGAALHRHVRDLMKLVKAGGKRAAQVGTKRRGISRHPLYAVCRTP